MNPGRGTFAFLPVAFAFLAGPELPATPTTAAGPTIANPEETRYVGGLAF